MARHTKGEWTNTLTGIKSDNGLLIAQCWYGQQNDSYGKIPAVPSYEEYCANGNLIASAPRMRELLNDCETVFNVMAISSDHLKLTPQIVGAINEVWPKIAELLKLNYSEGPKLHSK